MIDFRNLEYLAQGTDRQKLVYRAVVGSGVLESLAEYDPVVVSPHCVGLDLPVALGCELPLEELAAHVE